MIFEKLQQVREFERNRFPFMRSVEDRDLLLAIGRAQECGRPLSFKQVLLLAIGSPSTLQRRLLRLVAIGIVNRARSDLDKRFTELTIAPRTMKLFQQHERLMTALYGRKTKETTQGVRLRHVARTSAREAVPAAAAPTQDIQE